MQNESEAGEPQTKPVPSWAIHRRLYDWVLSLAHHKHSDTALFALSFTESSVFPIPPDVLQIALTLERRDKAWRYAFLSLLGSILGGIFGYVIGYAFWAVTQDFFFTYVFSEAKFDKVVSLYAKYDFWIVFVAAFTPIPYKVITITAGLAHLSFPIFIIASVIGRGARFYLVAAMLYWFGPKVKVFIERYFNILTLVFVAVLIGGFALLGHSASH